MPLIGLNCAHQRHLLLLQPLHGSFLRTSLSTLTPIAIASATPRTAFASLSTPVCFCFVAHFIHLSSSSVNVFVIHYFLITVSRSRVSVEELGRQCALRPAADESIMVDGDDAVGVARRLRALAHTIEGSVPVNQFCLYFCVNSGFYSSSAMVLSCCSGGGHSQHHSWTCSCAMRGGLPHRGRVGTLGNRAAGRRGSRAAIARACKRVIAGKGRIIKFIFHHAMYVKNRINRAQVTLN